jgi:hypothetical protein
MKEKDIMADPVISFLHATDGLFKGGLRDLSVKSKARLNG